MSVSDYTPTKDLVARKVQSRTRDQFGNLAGTFSATTTPTDTNVTAIIGDVITEVADVIGDDIPTALFDDAKNVVALKAAMQVELDFFPDQVNTGRSIYPQLSDQYEKALVRLTRAITMSEAGDGTVDDAGASLRPSYSFPKPTITLDRKM